MFRIKTDIRQYKCETKDKVEKLIRNWVIRPGDLIYHPDEKEWLPIGDHPAFTKLFVVLDEQERNTPDTVVTADSSLRGADESGATAVKADGEEEVTHIVERPEFEESDAEELRTTDVFDQDEVARTLAKKPVPEPPAGVEPLSNDEVTTMTERTLEMLKITDEDEEAAAKEDEEEITDVRKRKKADLPKPPANGAASVEVSPELLEESAEQDDATPVAAEGPPEEEEKPAARLGRHDLPEELFATNEISSPQVRERLEKLDDLADLASEPSEPTAAKPAKNGESWSLRLHEDSAVDEAWDEIAQDISAPTESREELRDTDELERQQAEAGEPAVDEDEPKEEALPEEEDELYEAEPYDDEDDWVEDTSEPHVAAADFVSEGYRIPLPFQVGPTPDDVRLGLKPTKYSRARKDRTFPVPEPKKLDEIHRRKFNLTPPPPRDQTWAIVLFVVLVIALITIIASNC